jgi:hypothetical protein
MDTKDRLEVYKVLFETWRFEVNSHWQRSSYFAAFETVAVAACWKLLDEQKSAWAGIVLSILGMLLTEIWRRNNNKTHFYAVYWLGKVTELEARLSSESGDSVYFATEILNRPRTGWIRHRHLVQAVPMIFFVAWIMLLGLGVFRAGIRQSWFLSFLHVEARPVYEMTPLILSIASLLVGVAAAWIAASSLSQARRVAEGAQRDWRQRKWFDLYFEADEAYDALDHFQVLYPSSLAPGWGSAEWERCWNDLMRAMRTVNRMAVAFPKNSVVDDLFSATAGFANPNEALSKDRLQQLLNAVEGLRQKSLVDATVLQ